MKKIFLILSFIILSLSVSAQKETGFFVGAGTGFNLGVDGLKFEDRVLSHIGSGFAGDFYAGAFFNKTFGVRAGYQGFGISNTYSDFGKYKYNYIHGDALIRLHRNVIPYVHAGWMKAANPSLGGGVGIMLPIHLGEHVSIVPDIKATLCGNQAFAVPTKGLASTVSATLGLAVRFGGKKKVAEESDSYLEPSDLAAPATEEVKNEEQAVSGNALTDNEVNGNAETGKAETGKEAAEEVKPEGNDNAAVDAVQEQPVEIEPISALALFDNNSSVLRKEALAELDKVVDWFAAHPEAAADIEGHTDNTASAAYNQALSERRAKAVLDYLVSKGVDASRLACRGFGFSQPVATNDTPEGRQQNRRVEIKVK